MKWKDRNHDYIDDLLIGYTQTEEQYQCARGNLERVHNANNDVSDKALAFMASDKAFAMLCLGEIQCIQFSTLDAALCAGLYVPDCINPIE